MDGYVLKLMVHKTENVFYAQMCHLLKELELTQLTTSINSINFFPTDHTNQPHIHGCSPEAYLGTQAIAQHL